MPFIAATALLLPAVAQGSKCLGITVQNLVELTPGFEMHRLLGGDLYCLASSRITRFARIPLTGAEHTKATQLDPAALDKGAADSLEHRANHRTGVAFRDVCR